MKSSKVIKGSLSRRGVEVSPPLFAVTMTDGSQLTACVNHMPTNAESMIQVSTGVCHYCDTEWWSEFQALVSCNLWLNTVTDKNIVYISGPMSDMPNFNKPAFWRMAHALKIRGARVRNPADHPPGQTYEWYMKRDFLMLLGCDVVVMLRGWKRSKGATAEHSVAKLSGLRILYEL